MADPTNRKVDSQRISAGTGFVSKSSPDAKELPIETRSIIESAQLRLGFGKTHRLCDVGDATFRRAMSGFPVMPLTRVKMTAFAEQWAKEHPTMTVSEAVWLGRHWQQDGVTVSAGIQDPQSLRLQIGTHHRVISADSTALETFEAWAELAWKALFEPAIQKEHGAE
jgi:hypothetical protein